MGKIKSALISWNEDNGYESTQISGWDYRNIKALPTMKDLVKVSNDKNKLINKIIKGNM
tara:strand:+ start:632 stop:808 length:177 start_codon:yes stop_codon:yes gene_type:complete